MSRILVFVLIVALTMTGTLLAGNLQYYYKKGTVILKGLNDFGKTNDTNGLWISFGDLCKRLKVYRLRLNHYYLRGWHGTFNSKMRVK